jgi:MFS family permease
MTDAGIRSYALINILPPMAGVGSAAIGSGLLHTLLPLRLHKLGYETGAIGLVVTGYSIGFLIGCLGVPMLIRHVGHVRANAAFAATAALMVMALDWAPWAWITGLLYGAIGLAAAGISVVTESWLNELVAPAWRTRVLTAYVLELALCYGIGQLIGLGIDVGGSHMPMLTAAFYMLALIPVVAIDVASPKPPHATPLRLLHAFEVSKVGALACLLTGLVSATFVGIGPLYGEALGLRQQSIIALMAAAQFGGMLLQWPLGFASDRYDRRYLMALMSLAMGAVAVALILFGRHLPFWTLAILLGSFGGTAESFYPIGVAHSNDRADPSEYVPLSSNLLLIWGIGGAIGPVVGSAALERIGPSGFFWYVLVLSAGFGVYALWRIRRAAKVALEQRKGFVAYPTSSPAILEWIPFRKLRGRDRP